MFFGLGRSTEMVTPQDALPGRSEPMPVPARHTVLDAPLKPEPDANLRTLYVGMGCFWGAERLFWRIPGVITTAAGYAGGFTPNPTYSEVCTGRTGHTEAVLVAYDPAQVDVRTLLATFWENHDPTTVNRQGNDVGTQYRSAIYWTTPEQQEAAEQTREAFGAVLREAGYGEIATELRPMAEAGPFYYAEREHQQYLAKNPRGYCNHGPNGFTCPVGLLSSDNVPAQTEVEPPR